MVVTDGRVLLGSDLEQRPGLRVLPRLLAVGRQTLRSDSDRAAIAAQARAGARGLQFLPPRRDDFLQTYLALAEHQQRHLISIHYPAAVDGAAREARICRQLLHPYQHIDVYEARALEGGLALLVTTAAELSDDGAQPAQVLALLRYLEEQVRTLVVTDQPLPARAWIVASRWQRLRSRLPGTTTICRFDAQCRRLVAVAQGRDLLRHIGAIAAPSGALPATAWLRYRGYSHAELDAIASSLRDAGLADAPRRDAVTFNSLPELPARFVEVVFLPAESERARLRAVARDPLWWKGAA